MRLNRHAITRRIFDVLRRPFLHRLITLVVSMLLAVSLIAAAMIMATSRSGAQIALLPAQMVFSLLLGTHG